MRSKLAKFILKVLSFGVTSDLNLFSSNRIKILNVTSLVFGLISFFYGLLFISQNLEGLGFFAIFCGLTFWSFLLFNKIGAAEDVKLVFFAVFYMNVYVYSTIIGERASIHYWLITTALISYVIFDIKDKRLPLTLLPGPILLTTLKVTQFSWTFFSKAPISPESQDYISIFMLPFAVMTGLGVLFFQLINYNKIEKNQQNIINKMNFLISSLDDIIFVISSDLKFKEVWCRDDSKLMLPRDQLLGRSCASILSPELWTVMSYALEDAKDKKIAVEVEYTTMSGAEKHWRLRVQPEIDADFNVESYAAKITDISEQYKLRKENDAQQIQILKSAKMSSLGEMAAGIAHEINNPLSIIYGKVDLLLGRLAKGNLDNEILKKDLNKIFNTADRISKIVKGLRLFSRPAENDPFRPENLDQIIGETIELFKEIVKHDSLTISSECNQDVFIDCRGSEISQVLMNLISNSSDAIASFEEKWIKIKVASGVDSVKIYVTDSGKGISPEVVNKMMEPFFSTKETGKGTGLGLSISKGIIEAHMGSLEYDFSSKNTRLIITLPGSRAVPIKNAA